MNLFERESSGKLVTPFSPVLDDPKTQKELEEHVVAQGAQSAKCHVIDAIIHLQNGAPIPVRIMMENGKFASVHYPNGLISSSWDRRLKVGMDYIADCYKKNPERDLLDKTRVHRFRSFFFNRIRRKKKIPSPAKPETGPKEKRHVWKKIAIAFAACFLLACFIGMVTTITTIAIRFGQRAAVTPDKTTGSSSAAGATAAAKGGEIPIETPYPFRPSQEQAQTKPAPGKPAQPEAQQPQMQTTQNPPSQSAEKVVPVADVIVRDHACITPAVTVHSGELNVGFCGCKHETVGPVDRPGRTACTWFVLNGGSEEQEFSIKTPLRATENTGMSTFIDHGDVECGGTHTLELQPGVPVACYLEYDDDSNGMSRSVTLNLGIRWNHQYGSLPTAGPIPIS